MANESDYPVRYSLEDGSGFLLLETGTEYLLKETQDYAELVSSDGAFLYFRLDEASGNFVDLAGGRTGTATGSAMTYAQTGAIVGDTDTSVEYTADGQYISLAGETAFSPAGHSDSMTIEFWLYPTLDARLNTLGRLNDGIDWETSVQFQSSVGTVDVAFAAANVASGTTASLVSAGFTLANISSSWLNSWHYLAAVWDSVAAASTVYLDLRVSPAAAWTGTPKPWSSGTLQLGNSAGNTIRGRLDEVAFYPTALTAAQIARHYRAGLQFLPDIPPPIRLAAH